MIRCYVLLGLSKEGKNGKRGKKKKRVSVGVWVGPRTISKVKFVLPFYIMGGPMEGASIVGLYARKGKVCGLPQERAQCSPFLYLSIAVGWCGGALWPPKRIPHMPSDTLNTTTTRYKRQPHRRPLSRLSHLTLSRIN